MPTWRKSGPAGEQSTVNTVTLVSVDEAAKYCKVSVEVIERWTSSRHAPHYFVDGEGPLYRKSEIAKWVNEHLVTANTGLPVPKTLVVIKTAGLPNTTHAPPLPIAGLETLCHIDLSTGVTPGVYFLCAGGEVVYVGQSLCVVARLATHVREGVKEFDHHRVYFLPCPPDQLMNTEAAFIRALNPKYNGGKLRKESAQTQQDESQTGEGW